MYIYIYIYTHVYTYIHTHTHTYIYIYIYIYKMSVLFNKTWICVCIHGCVCESKYVCVHLCVYMCVSACVRAYAYACLCKLSQRAYFCIYIYIYWAISLMSRLFANGPGELGSIESHQRLKKWYLMPPSFSLTIIRWGSRVKWSNPANRVAPSPTPQCSSYWKGSLWVTLD